MQSLEEAAPELVLDARHTLVSVAAPAQLLLGQGEEAWSWLLFRAPGEEPTTAQAEPRLWLLSAGQRRPLELVQAAGWDQSGGPAVALFRAPARGPRGSARATLEVAGGEIVGEIPAGGLAPSPRP